MGKDLGLPADLVQRHPFPGPGLAIRILCQSEPYLEKDFAETQVLCRLVVNYGSMVEKVRLSFSKNMKKQFNGIIFRNTLSSTGSTALRPKTRGSA